MRAPSPPGSSRVGTGLLALGLLALSSACSPGSEHAAAGKAEAGALSIATGEDRETPPLGRYVCRQYMTTIGYIDLTAEGYSIGSVKGGYAYDAESGEIEWRGGVYAGWPARYELRSAESLGRAEDENIIRMTDEAGSLTIDCFLMKE